MNKHEIIAFISILVVLAMAIFINASNVSKETDSPDTSPTTNEEDNQSITDDPQTIF